MPLRGDNPALSDGWRPLQDWQRENVFVQRRKTSETQGLLHSYPDIEGIVVSRMDGKTLSIPGDSYFPEWLAQRNNDFLPVSQQSLAKRELSFLLRDDAAHDERVTVRIRHQPSDDWGIKKGPFHVDLGVFDKPRDQVASDGKQWRESNVGEAQGLTEQAREAGDQPSAPPKDSEQGGPTEGAERSWNGHQFVLRQALTPGQSGELLEQNMYVQCLHHLEVINACTELQQGLKNEMKKQAKLDNMINRKMLAKTERLNQLLSSIERTNVPGWVQPAFQELKDHVSQQAQAHYVYVTALTSQCDAIQQSLDGHHELMKSVLGHGIELRTNTSREADCDFDADSMSFLQASNAFEEIRKPRIRLTNKLEYLQSQLAATSTQLKEVEDKIESTKKSDVEMTTLFKLEDFQIRADFLRSHHDQLQADVKVASMEINDFDFTYRDTLLEVFNIFHQHRNRYDTALRKCFQLLSAVSLRDNALTMELLSKEETSTMAQGDNQTTKGARMSDPGTNVLAQTDHSVIGDPAAHLKPADSAHNPGLPSSGPRNKVLSLLRAQEAGMSSDSFSNDGSSNDSQNVKDIKPRQTGQKSVTKTGQQSVTQTPTGQVSSRHQMSGAWRANQETTAAQSKSCVAQKTTSQEQNQGQRSGESRRGGGHDVNFSRSHATGSDTKITDPGGNNGQPVLKGSVDEKLTMAEERSERASRGRDTGNKPDPDSVTTTHNSNSGSNQVESNNLKDGSIAPPNSRCYTANNSPSNPSLHEKKASFYSLDVPSQEARNITEIRVERGLIAKYARETVQSSLRSAHNWENSVRDESRPHSNEFKPSYQSPAPFKPDQNGGVTDARKGLNYVNETQFCFGADELGESSGISRDRSFSASRMTKIADSFIPSNGRESELIGKYATPRGQKRSLLGTNYNNCETPAQRVETVGDGESEDRLEFDPSQEVTMEALGVHSDHHSRRVCTVRPISSDPEASTEDDETKDGAVPKNCMHRPRNGQRRVVNLSEYEVTAGLFMAPKDIDFKEAAEAVGEVSNKYNKEDRDIQASTPNVAPQSLASKEIEETKECGHSDQQMIVQQNGLEDNSIEVTTVSVHVDDNRFNPMPGHQTPAPADTFSGERNRDSHLSCDLDFPRNAYMASYGQSDLHFRNQYPIASETRSCANNDDLQVLLKGQEQNNRITMSENPCERRGYYELYEAISTSQDVSTSQSVSMSHAHEDTSQSGGNVLTLYEVCNEPGIRSDLTPIANRPLKSNLKKETRYLYYAAEAQGELPPPSEVESCSEIGSAQTFDAQRCNAALLTHRPLKCTKRVRFDYIVKFNDNTEKIDSQPTRSNLDQDFNDSQLMLSHAFSTTHNNNNNNFVSCAKVRNCSEKNCTARSESRVSYSLNGGVERETLKQGDTVIGCYEDKVSENCNNSSNKERVCVVFSGKYQSGRKPMSDVPVRGPGERNQAQSARTESLEWRLSNGRSNRERLIFHIPRRPYKFRRPKRPRRCMDAEGTNSMSEQRGVEGEPAPFLIPRSLESQLASSRSNITDPPTSLRLTAKTPKFGFVKEAVHDKILSHKGEIKPEANRLINYKNSRDSLVKTKSRKRLRLGIRFRGRYICHRSKPHRRCVNQCPAMNHVYCNPGFTWSHECLHSGGDLIQSEIGAPPEFSADGEYPSVFCRTENYSPCDLMEPLDSPPDSFPTEESFLSDRCHLLSKDLEDCPLKRMRETNQRGFRCQQNESYFYLHPQEELYCHKYNKYQPCCLTCQKDQPCCHTCQQYQPCCDSCQQDQSCCLTCQKDQPCCHTCQQYQPCCDTCQQDQPCCHTCQRDQPCCHTNCQQDQPCCHTCQQDQPCCLTCQQDEAYGKNCRHNLQTFVKFHHKENIHYNDPVLEVSNFSLFNVSDHTERSPASTPGLEDPKSYHTDHELQVGLEDPKSYHTDHELQVPEISNPLKETSVRKNSGYFKNIGKSLKLIMSWCAKRAKQRTSSDSEATCPIMNSIKQREIVSPNSRILEDDIRVSGKSPKHVSELIHGVINLGYDKPTFIFPSLKAEQVCDPCDPMGSAFRDTVTVDSLVLSRQLVHESSDEESGGLPNSKQCAMSRTCSLRELLLRASQNQMTIHNSNNNAEINGDEESDRGESGGVDTIVNGSNIKRDIVTEGVQRDNSQATEGVQRDNSQVTERVQRDNSQVTEGVQRENSQVTEGVQRENSQVTEGVQRDNSQVTEGVQRDNSQVTEGVQRDNSQATEGVQRDNSQVTKGLQTHCSGGFLASRPRDKNNNSVKGIKACPQPPLRKRYSIRRSEASGKPGGLKKERRDTKPVPAGKCAFLEPASRLGTCRARHVAKIANKQRVLADSESLWDRCIFGVSSATAAENKYMLEAPCNKLVNSGNGQRQSTEKPDGDDKANNAEENGQLIQQYTLPTFMRRMTRPSYSDTHVAELAALLRAGNLEGNQPQGQQVSGYENKDVKEDEGKRDQYLAFNVKTSEAKMAPLSDKCKDVGNEVFTFDTVLSQSSKMPYSDDQLTSLPEQADIASVALPKNSPLNRLKTKILKTKLKLRPLFSKYATFVPSMPTKALVQTKELSSNMANDAASYGVMGRNAEVNSDTGSGAAINGILEEVQKETAELAELLVSSEKQLETIKSIHSRYVNFDENTRKKQLLKDIQNKPAEKCKLKSLSGSEARQEHFITRNLGKNEQGSQSEERSNVHVDQLSEQAVTSRHNSERAKELVINSSGFKTRHAPLLQHKRPTVCSSVNGTETEQRGAAELCPTKHGAWEQRWCYGRTANQLPQEHVIHNPSQLFVPRRCVSQCRPYSACLIRAMHKYQSDPMSLYKRRELLAQSLRGLSAEDADIPLMRKSSPEIMTHPARTQVPPDHTRLKVDSSVGKVRSTSTENSTCSSRSDSRTTSGGQDSNSRLEGGNLSSCLSQEKSFPKQQKSPIVKKSVTFSPNTKTLYRNPTWRGDQADNFNVNMVIGKKCFISRDTRLKTLQAPMNPEVLNKNVSVKPSASSVKSKVETSPGHLKQQSQFYLSNPVANDYGLKIKDALRKYIVRCNSSKMSLVHRETLAQLHQSGQQLESIDATSNKDSAKTRPASGGETSPRNKSHQYELFFKNGTTRLTVPGDEVNVSSDESFSKGDSRSLALGESCPGGMKSPSQQHLLVERKSPASREGVQDVQLHDESGTNRPNELLDSHLQSASRHEPPKPVPKSTRELSNRKTSSKMSLQISPQVKQIQKKTQQISKTVQIHAKFGFAFSDSTSDNLESTLPSIKHYPNIGPKAKADGSLELPHSPDNPQIQSHKNISTELSPQNRANKLLMSSKRTADIYLTQSPQNKMVKPLTPSPQRKVDKPVTSSPQRKADRPSTQSLQMKFDKPSTPPPQRKVDRPLTPSPQSKIDKPVTTPQSKVDKPVTSPRSKVDRPLTPSPQKKVDKTLIHSLQQRFEHSLNESTKCTAEDIVKYSPGRNVVKLTSLSAGSQSDHLLTLSRSSKVEQMLTASLVSKAKQMLAASLFSTAEQTLTDSFVDKAEQMPKTSAVNKPEQIQTGPKNVKIDKGPSKLKSNKRPKKVPPKSKPKKLPSVTARGLSVTAPTASRLDKTELPVPSRGKFDEWLAISNKVQAWNLMNVSPEGESDQVLPAVVNGKADNQPKVSPLTESDQSKKVTAWRGNEHLLTGLSKTAASLKVSPKCNAKKKAQGSPTANLTLLSDNSEADDIRINSSKRKPDKARRLAKVTKRSHSEKQLIKSASTSRSTTEETSYSTTQIPADGKIRQSSLKVEPHRVNFATGGARSFNHPPQSAASEKPLVALSRKHQTVKTTFPQNRREIFIKNATHYHHDNQGKRGDAATYQRETSPALDQHVQGSDCLKLPQSCSPEHCTHSSPSPMNITDTSNQVSISNVFPEDSELSDVTDTNVIPTIVPDLIHVSREDKRSGAIEGMQNSFRPIKPAKEFKTDAAFVTKSDPENEMYVALDLKNEDRTNKATGTRQVQPQIAADDGNKGNKHPSKQESRRNLLKAGRRKRKKLSARKTDRMKIFPLNKVSSKVTGDEIAPKSEARVTGDEIAPKSEARVTGDEIAPKSEARVTGDEIAPKSEARVTGDEAAPKSPACDLGGCLSKHGGKITKVLKTRNPGCEKASGSVRTGNTPGISNASTPSHSFKGGAKRDVSRTSTAPSVTNIDTPIKDMRRNKSHVKVRESKNLPPDTVRHFDQTENSTSKMVGSVDKTEISTTKTVGSVVKFENSTTKTVGRFKKTAPATEISDPKLRDKKLIQSRNPPAASATGPSVGKKEASCTAKNTSTAVVVAKTLHRFTAAAETKMTRNTVMDRVDTLNSRQNDVSSTKIKPNVTNVSQKSMSFEGGTSSGAPAQSLTPCHVYDIDKYNLSRTPRVKRISHIPTIPVYNGTGMPMGGQGAVAASTGMPMGGQGAVAARRTDLDRKLRPSEKRNHPIFSLTSSGIQNSLTTKFPMEGIGRPLNTVSFCGSNRRMPMVVTNSHPLIVTNSAPLVETSSGPLAKTSIDPLVVTSNVPLAVTSGRPLVTNNAPLIKTSSAPLSVANSAPLIVTTKTPSVVAHKPPLADRKRALLVEKAKDRLELALTLPVSRVPPEDIKEITYKENIPTNQKSAAVASHSSVTENLTTGKITDHCEQSNPALDINHNTVSQNSNNLSRDTELYDPSLTYCYSKQFFKTHPKRRKAQRSSQTFRHTVPAENVYSTMYYSYSNGVMASKYSIIHEGAREGQGFNSSYVWNRKVGPDLIRWVEQSKIQTGVIKSIRRFRKARKLFSGPRKGQTVRKNSSNFKKVCSGMDTSQKPLGASGVNSVSPHRKTNTRAFHDFTSPSSPSSPSRHDLTNSNQPDLEIQYPREIKSRAETREKTPSSKMIGIDPPPGCETNMSALKIGVSKCSGVSPKDPDVGKLSDCQNNKYYDLPTKTSRANVEYERGDVPSTVVEESTKIYREVASHGIAKPVNSSTKENRYLGIDSQVLNNVLKSNEPFIEPRPYSFLAQRWERNVVDIYNNFLNKKSRTYEGNRDKDKSKEEANTSGRSIPSYLRGYSNSQSYKRLDLPQFGNSVYRVNNAGQREVNQETTTFSPKKN